MCTSTHSVARLLPGEIWYRFTQQPCNNFYPHKGHNVVEIVFECSTLWSFRTLVFRGAVELCFVTATRGYVGDGKAVDMVKRQGSSSVRRFDTSPVPKDRRHGPDQDVGVRKLTSEPSSLPTGQSFDLIAEKYHLTQESLINVGQIAAVLIWAMLGGVHVSYCPGAPERPEGSSENL